MSTPEEYTDITTTFFNPEREPWDEIGGRILQIEKLCFPDDTSYTEEDWQALFESESTIVVMLKNGEDIIGYTVAIPDENYEGALYVETTCIHPDWQGKGLVAQVMDQLETRAINQGYTALTRDAVIDNGYADKISEHYAGRIIDTYEHDSQYGRQRYFAIDLT